MSNRIKFHFFNVIIIISFFSTSCKKFLDVVPDNAPVLDQAFNLRSMAIRYLATCYTTLPSNFSTSNNPGWFSGDEFWLNSESNFPGFTNWRIALGLQNGDNPLLNNWDGTNGGVRLWNGITNCNIFLNNIMKVPDMTEAEKLMWASEAKFLKAYYHFLLLKQYGPIPIMDKEIPTSAPVSESQLPRNSIDECFSYITNLMDEGIDYLMEDITNPLLENGRVTKLVALSIKAKILIYAASPLFNGNVGQEANLKNNDGKVLFNQTYVADKWKAAADACKAAIDFAQSRGKRLHKWIPPNTILVTPQTSTVTQTSIREAFNESSNSEILWLDTRSIAKAAIQGAFMVPRFTANATNSNLYGYISVTLNTVEKFYSANGVPIEEDKTYPYSQRYNLIAVPSTDAYRYDLTVGRSIPRMHLDREDRFYGSLVFDGGRLFQNQTTSDASSYNVELLYGSLGGRAQPSLYNVTGYASKKHYNVQNTVGASAAFSARTFGYPIIRLADLYLFYAEALNEYSGPSPAAYAYVDSVRKRAGLEGVVTSWANYSISPGKPLTKEGLREIIKRERTSEFALEGVRFDDLRRWKDAIVELNTGITGWDINQNTAAAYFRPLLLYNRSFQTRDYFTPLSLTERQRNPNLVQAAGW